MDRKVLPRFRLVRLIRPAFGLTVLLVSALAFGASQEPAGEPDLRFQTWLGPEGKPLPFESLEEIEEFLLKARVIDVKGIDQGITKPRKMTLESDGIVMNAIFRDVDDRRRRWDDRRYGIQLDFHDYCVHEYAAYRLSRLLGVGHVPPTVRRTFRRDDFSQAKQFAALKKKRGTLQAWVEAAMTEKDRLAEGTSPPDVRRWSDLHHLMNLWDSLVFNLDRNQGNMLIGPDWKLWLIDHTRAFRPLRALRDEEKVRKCDRAVWWSLREVEDSAIEAELRGALPPIVLRALLERRRLLVARLQSLIDRDGEETVLFDIY